MHPGRTAGIPGDETLMTLCSNLKKAGTLFLLVLVFLSTASPSFAQQPTTQTQETDVIRINTNLVQLRVVVTDKAGKPVENLKQEDFEVLENGQPQKITLFSLDRIGDRVGDRAGNEAAAEPKPPGTQVQSTTPAPVKPTARSIVLFVDTFNMSAASFARAKQHLKRFIDESVTDQDLVAIVPSSGSLGVLGQFMRDRVRLKNAIDRITRFSDFSSFFSPYLAARVLSEEPAALALATKILAIEEGDSMIPPPPDVVRAKAQEILSFAALTRKSTLQMLKAVCERMSEMPGQRMVAFVSDGFTLLDRGGDDRQDYEQATSRAIKSGVIIYSFSAEGLTTPVEAQARVSSGLSDFKNPAFANYMADTRTDQQNTLRFLAADTGGEAFLNSNDLVGQFKRMLDANKVYYAIGYSPAGEPSKKFRNIKVRLMNHPEYHLRTQRGYQPFEDKVEKAATTPQERLMQAMLKPLPLTNLSVTSSASFLRRASDEDQLTLQVLLGGGALEYQRQPGKYLLKCELVTLIIDHSGKAVSTFAETMSATLTPEQFENAKTRGFRYTRRLDVKPGLYQVRVGVRDLNSNTMGTAMSWVEVPKLQDKKLVLSSIFIGRTTEPSAPQDTKDAKKPVKTALVVGSPLFKKAEPIFYRFVVYNAPAESANDLVFRLEILEAGKSLYDGGWQPLNPRVVRRDAIGLEVGGQLQMDMGPGIYTLRITVRTSKSKQSTPQTLDLEIGT